MANAAATVADFLNTKKLQTTKASAGKFTYFDDPGEYLVRIESTTFGFKTMPDGEKGPPFFAVENKILTSTSNEPHLRVGRTASMYAVNEGKQAQVYLSKIKNTIEAVMDARPEELEEPNMTPDAFSKLVQGLFFDTYDAAGSVIAPAGAVGEILVIKAAKSKNKAKEDRVYSSYCVAADDQLAAGGYMRNEKGVIVPLAQ